MIGIKLFSSVMLVIEALTHWQFVCLGSRELSTTASPIASQCPAHVPDLTTERTFGLLM